MPSALDQCADPAFSRIWYGTDAYEIDAGQQRLLKDAGAQQDLSIEEIEAQIEELKAKLAEEEAK